MAFPLAPVTGGSSEPSFRHGQAGGGDGEREARADEAAPTDYDALGELGHG